MIASALCSLNFSRLPGTKKKPGYLLPKWYGKPGDAEKFAETIADRLGGPQGNFVYFAIALVDNCSPTNLHSSSAFLLAREGCTRVEDSLASVTQRTDMCLKWWYGQNAEVFG